MERMKVNNHQLVVINTIVLVVCFLYLFDAFHPRLQEATSILNKGVSHGNSSGLNERSVFWILIFVVVVLFSFYRAFFKDMRWVKTYFFGITLIVFFSIAWADSPATTFTRVFLWLLAGGATTMLYIQESRYGDTKTAFIFLSGILLFINLGCSLLFPSGAFDLLGAMSGIHSSKNGLGAIAAIFTILLAGMLIQYEFYAPRVRIIILIMIFVWFLFLLLSQSKSSIFFTIVIIPSLYLFQYRVRYAIYTIYSLVFIILCVLPIVWYLTGGDYFFLLANIMPPELFTGRGMIWSYMMTEFQDFLLLGVGYGGYWTANTRDVFDIEYSFFTVLNSSHNGYIHIITNIGVIGLSLFLGLTLFKLIKHWRRLELWELGVLIFISFHAFFETEFFLYKNVWVLFCAVLTRIEYPFSSTHGSITQE